MNRVHATGKITVKTYEPAPYDQPGDGPVPGSGTSELAGLRGQGGFTAQLGEGADITLDYWFE